VIGLRVVAADGRLVRAGGKVVKNVAGYDLVKLYIGSHGTLGIIVDATLKLRPRPATEGGAWATFPTLDATAAAGAMLAASELGPVALTLVDVRGTGEDACPLGLPSGSGPALLVVFDGLRSTVAWQVDQAAERLRAAGARTVERLDPDGTERALGAVRDPRRLVASPAAIATAGVLPAEVGPYLTAAHETARAAGVTVDVVAHAGQGVVTLVLVPGAAPPPATVTARVLAEWRDAARRREGHLVVDWAPLGVREACPPWDPPGPGLGLMRGLKARLDPQGVLNPGRFVGGI
jgi:glycolate oxidase FAD binding subunit